jgi:hypothetical protein
MRADARARNKLAIVRFTAEEFSRNLGHYRQSEAVAAKQNGGPKVSVRRFSYLASGSAPLAAA